MPGCGFTHKPGEHSAADLAIIKARYAGPAYKSRRSSMICHGCGNRGYVIKYCPNPSKTQLTVVPAAPNHSAHAVQHDHSHLHNFVASEDPLIRDHVPHELHLTEQTCRLHRQEVANSLKRQRTLSSGRCATVDVVLRNTQYWFGSYVATDKT